VKRARQPVLIFIMLVAITPSIFAQALLSADVNLIDRGLIFPYSKTLDIASDITQYAAFASPAALLFVVPKSDYVETALMYAGSSLLAFGAGSLIKALVPRDRPYMYFDSPPSQAAVEGDESFPSRHSCIAFSAAAFSSTLFALRYPNSPYTGPRNPCFVCPGFGHRRPQGGLGQSFFKRRCGWCPHRHCFGGHHSPCLRQGQIGKGRLPRGSLRGATRADRDIFSLAISDGLFIHYHIIKHDNGA